MSYLNVTVDALALDIASNALAFASDFKLTVCLKKAIRFQFILIRLSFS